MRGFEGRTVGRTDKEKVGVATERRRPHKHDLETEVDDTMITTPVSAAERDVKLPTNRSLLLQLFLPECSLPPPPPP